MDEKRAYDRFTANEREILFGLVNSKSAVIEDKRTSFSVLMAKKKAWQDIADGFNSYADVTHRSAPQLKKCWENEKARRKKLLAAESEGEWRLVVDHLHLGSPQTLSWRQSLVLPLPTLWQVLRIAIQFYLQLQGLRRLVRPSLHQRQHSQHFPVKLSSRPVVDQTLTTKQRTGKSYTMAYNRKCSPLPLLLHVKRWNHR
uniref:Myb/SANT-like DNA-binding domain-containing protein 3 n=1 Tax=Timema monikensis TaxID=170555 RepID=A0A7R9ECE2_9NEOP|nr:unnamed protein product [Timema monikensis]